jgi:hypothetical protein
LLLLLGPATAWSAIVGQLGADLGSNRGAFAAWMAVLAIALAASVAAMTAPALVLAWLSSPRTHDDANRALAALGLMALGLAGVAFVGRPHLLVVGLDLAASTALLFDAARRMRMRRRWLGRVSTGSEPGWLLRPRSTRDRELMPLSGREDRCDAVLEAVEQTTEERIVRHAPVALVSTEEIRAR